MNKRQNQLWLRQLDEKLLALASLKSVPPPRKGWISEIRRALGMSAAQLAHRLGVSRPAVSQHEKAEVDGGITLNSLRKMASALECDLVYALVPQAQLEDVVREQARRVAVRMHASVAHSMQLEKQDVPQEETARQIEDLAQQLTVERPRSLWDEH
jgi:predicted DNA-binding mobile mystery protein A